MYVLLFAAGLWFSVGTGFWQVRRFGLMFKRTFGKMFKKTDSAGITPFQAMSTALASTVGTGNVAGVATAITVGGPGAIFWMWVSSFLGMMTKYAEVLLAVRYRHRDKDGHWVGGPMYTIERGLGKRWKPLAVIFAFFGMGASLGVGNITQVNTMASALSGSFGVPQLLTGIITAVLAGVVIFGGIRSIAGVCEFLVPVMSGIYIVAAVGVLIAFRHNILPAFSLIIDAAFHPAAAAGGISGYLISAQAGVGRGVFSNEAGLGSAPIAHATAETEHPAEQGMWGAAEVFVDTIVICTLTALVILCSGAYTPGGASLNGAALSLRGFELGLGSWAGPLIAVCTALFALATVLGWSFYGERCCEYLFGDGPAKKLYRAAYILLLIPGSVMGIDTVWALADLLNGLMIAPNLVSLFALSGVVFKVTKEYGVVRK